MHVPGVKQEQPDRKPVSVGPLTTDIMVRDENDTRIVKVMQEDPHKVIGILNSLVERNGGKMYIDAVVRDGGRNRLLKLSGEQDTGKVIRILNSLIRKTREKTPSTSSEPVTNCCPEVVSS